MVPFTFPMAGLVGVSIHLFEHWIQLFIQISSEGLNAWSRPWV